MQTRANGRSAFIIIAAGLLALTTIPARACDTSDCGRIVLAQNADPQEQQAQTDAAAAPEPAAETSKAGKKKSRHTKTSSRAEKAAEKSDKLASKTSASEKKSPDKMFGADKTADQGDRASSKIETGKSEITRSEAANSDDNKPNVSPWANANAQMGAAPTGATAAAQDAVKSLTANTTVTDSPRPVTTMAVRVTPQTATADTAPTTEDDAQVIASDQLNELDRAAETNQKPASKILRPTSQTAQTASASSDDAWSQTSLIGKIFIGFGGLLTLASAARMFIA